MPNPITSIQLITAALQAEFGDKCLPQIGLFATSKPQLSELPVAQQAFTEQLVNAVNASIDRTLGASSTTPARVLLAGESLAAVASALAANNVTVVWLAGNSAQCELVTDSSTAPVQVLEGSVLGTDLSGKFDCILYAATFQYLDQLPLLTRFRELLCPSGRLLVVSEFLQDDSEMRPSSLANLSSHQQLGTRLGFCFEDVTDYSAAALQSVHLLRQVLARHQSAISAALALDRETEHEWLDAFAMMEHELTTGRRCYQLQHWRLPDRSQSSEQVDSLGEYALAEYGDIESFSPPEISTLFEQSFDKPFDPALWHWKYQLGHGKCVVARIERGGDIVAHYGGAPRQISYFGHPGMAIQVCDVMVLPEKRRQYGKSSLFFKVAATFLEREIGNSVNHLLGFGFPNQSAMNIALRLGLYEKTDDFVEVVFAPPQKPEPDLDVLEFDIENEDHRAAAAQLWLDMQEDFSHAIIGQRHTDYLRYRYIDHPGASNYSCRLLRDPATGEILAFFVLKAHGESRLLFDFICPLERVEVLIANVNQWVKHNTNAVDLRLWITRGWLHAIPTISASVNELGIEIPCNSWNPGPSAATLYGKWWLTAGDMDFM